MNNGNISGNTSSSTTLGGGGGVHVSSGTFTKTNGTIYGYTAGDNNSNVAQNSSGTVQSNRGHAVYAAGGGYNNSTYAVTKRKETTAGTGVNLSFNGDGTFSGGWDY